MHPVFSTWSFWQPYLTLEPEEVDQDDLHAQMESLRSDFVVRADTFHFEVQGKQESTVRRVVEFPFFCGESYILLIEYEPDIAGCSLNLSLVDARTGKKHEMGWWDLARWHPYCIRQEEFDRLLEFWTRRDPRWPDPNLPLLLLCQFVGLPDEEARKALALRAKTALQALRVPHVEGRRPRVPLQVPDGDFRWELDRDLGWVFTSDEYCCYSIRNRPHADSDEGRFPFTAFRELMAGVETWLNEN